MKKSFVLAIVFIVSGCAKERTTPYQHMVVGPATTSILTNANYDQQQLDKKNATAAKPYTAPENAISLEESLDQKDLAELFTSYDAPEVQLPKPEGVICELIPQLRVQKTLGRLSCTKQSPVIGNEVAIQNATSYHCSLDPTQSEENMLSDRLIYDGLNFLEAVNPNGYIGTDTFTKSIGHFHCNKIIQRGTGALRYECAVDMIAK